MMTFSPAVATGLLIIGGLVCWLVAGAVALSCYYQETILLQARLKASEEKLKSSEAKIKWMEKE